MVQSNQWLVQLLLSEGARYVCNGGYLNTVELLMDKFHVAEKEALEILLGSALYEGDRNSILARLDKIRSDEEEGANVGGGVSESKKEKGK